MSSEIQSIQGRGIPLSGNDIDTDRIIPARFLRCVTFDGLGQQVFADDRREGAHPFDAPAYQGAEILVVNANFGCGSSREHAPQAITRWGIRAIIGESFAEIFFGNCLAMGIPCATATSEVVQALQVAIANDPSQTLSLDIAGSVVHFAEQSYPVSFKAGPQSMLLKGTWDTCGQLAAQAEAVQATAAQLPYIRW